MLVSACTISWFVECMHHKQNLSPCRTWSSAPTYTSIWCSRNNVLWARAYFFLRYGLWVQHGLSSTVSGYNVDWCWGPIRLHFSQKLPFATIDVTYHTVLRYNVFRFHDPIYPCSREYGPVGNVQQMCLCLFVFLRSQRYGSDCSGLSSWNGPVPQYVWTHFSHLKIILELPQVWILVLSLFSGPSWSILLKTRFLSHIHVIMVFAFPMYSMHTTT